MLMIVAVLALFCGMAFLLAVFLVHQQEWAKRQASIMLKSKTVDTQNIERVLRLLSTTKDNEGTRLYAKLADLAGR